MLVIMCSSLYAAALTDSTKPLGELKFATSVEGNYIFDKNIRKSTTDTKFVIEDISQLYTKLTLGLSPYFNIYTKLGISDGGTIRKETITPAQYDIETEHNLLAGIGITGLDEIFPNWMIGIDTQFNWWKVDVDAVSFMGGTATETSGEIENFEVQGIVFITTNIEFIHYDWLINPYFGLKVSYFSTDTDGQIHFKDSAGNLLDTSWALKGDDNFGIIIGTDWEVTPDFTMQIEGRFVDETALSGGVTYRF